VVAALEVPMVRSPRTPSFVWPVAAEDVARVRVIALQRPLRPQALALPAGRRVADQARTLAVLAVVGAAAGSSAAAIWLNWLH